MQKIKDEKWNRLPFESQERVQQFEKNQHFCVEMDSTKFKSMEITPKLEISYRMCNSFTHIYLQVQTEQLSVIGAYKYFVCCHNKINVMQVSTNSCHLHFEVIC